MHVLTEYVTLGKQRADTFPEGVVHLHVQIKT
jgi:hypothetical protein